MKHVFSNESGIDETSAIRKYKLDSWQIFQPMHCRSIHRGRKVRAKCPREKSGYQRKYIRLCYTHPNAPRLMGLMTSKSLMLGTWKQN